MMIIEQRKVGKTNSNRITRFYLDENMTRDDYENIYRLMRIFKDNTFKTFVDFVVGIDINSKATERVNSHFQRILDMRWWVSRGYQFESLSNQIWQYYKDGLITKQQALGMMQDIVKEGHGINSSIFEGNE